MNNNTMLYNTYEVSFIANRIIDASFVPTQFYLSIQMINSVNKNGAESMEEVKKEVIKFQLITFWINSLSDAIFVEYGDSWAQKFINSFSPANKVVVCPGFPSDDMILRLLFEKIIAIGGKYINLLSGQLKSNDSDNIYTNIEWGGVSSLPDISYVGDATVLHKLPWWQRPTSDTSEFFLQDGNSDVNPIQLQQDILIRLENSLLNSSMTPQSFNSAITDVLMNYENEFDLNDQDDLMNEDHCDYSEDNEDDEDDEDDGGSTNRGGNIISPSFH